MSGPAVWSAPCLVLALACAPARGVDGPPEVFYGLEECAHCRMIISEERWAVAAVSPSRGVRKYDDLGCLLAARGDAPPEPGEIAWVHDSGSGAWIRAETSWFALGEPIATPMGSGALAFASRAEALAASAEEPMSWHDLLETGAEAPLSERRDPR